MNTLEDQEKKKKRNCQLDYVEVLRGGKQVESEFTEENDEYYRPMNSHSKCSTTQSMENIPWAAQNLF